MKCSAGSLRTLSSFAQPGCGYHQKTDHANQSLGGERKGRRRPFRAAFEVFAGEFGNASHVCAGIYV